jgi:hypothetical protein
MHRLSVLQLRGAAQLAELTGAPAELNLYVGLNRRASQVHQRSSCAYPPVLRGLHYKTDSENRAVGLLWPC